MSHFTNRTEAGLCGRCGRKPRVKNYSMCQRCRKQVRELMAAKQQSRRKAGLCIDCGKKSRGFQSCKKCRERRRLNLVAERSKLRDEVFAAYGGARCSCRNCPEHKNPHIEFLTINHIDGGGTKHRARLGGKRATGGGVSGYATYRWLRRNGFPTGYNVLCWNCQWGSHLKGVCPHKKGVSL